jgi:hypothetical protein
MTKHIENFQESKRNTMSRIHMDSPIFVMGPPRSGTTLVARILGRHSNIFMPGETHFFDDIYSRRKELGNPQDPMAMEKIITRLATLYARYNEPPDQERVDQILADPAILDDLKASCRTYGDILSLFMQLQVHQAGKKRWGNHVPKDIFHIKDILAFYPDAKFLICIRDVRDFLLSYQYQANKGGVTSPENVQRLQRLYHPLVTSFLWKTSVKRIDRAKSLLPERNLMVFRYESLIERPEEIVRNICTFVGEAFEKSMLEVNTHNSSFRTQNSGIFAASVGRWRGKLSPEEAYVAQKVARRALIESGYSIERINVNPGKLTKIVLTFPYAFWRALHANRKNRGPLLSYLIRRATNLL